MKAANGVYTTRRKDGNISYRASITCKGKHISLGSFSTKESAHKAYEEATALFRTQTFSLEAYQKIGILPFKKWVSLLNFRDNGIYCKTPIYIYSNYFLYYFSKDDYLKFDVDDLFYYSKHTIQRRGGHLFVADFGTQYNILNRYGIKNFAVQGRDYRFVNGDHTDFRYKNIEIINKYHGVTKETIKGRTQYIAKIHINGDYQIGTYNSEIEAAVAYNKAAHILQEKGLSKNFPKNYVVELSEQEYHSLFQEVYIAKGIRTYGDT